MVGFCISALQGKTKATTVFKSGLNTGLLPVVFMNDPVFAESQPVESQVVTSDEASSSGVARPEVVVVVMVVVTVIKMMPPPSH